MRDYHTIITCWKDNARAALTLTFDGCYADSWNLAHDVLTRYHIPSTWFLVTGTVGGVLQERPVVTWEKLKKRSDLVEIASHTVTHPRLKLPFRKRIPNYTCSAIKKFKKLFTSNLAQKIKRVGSNIYKDCQGVSYLEVLHEAEESKTTIEFSLNLKEILSFAYPGGRYNSSLKKGIAELGYLSARSTENGYNFVNSLDFYALKSKVWDLTINAEQANKWVDDAIDKGVWLVETYHLVSQKAATGYRYNTTLSDFDNHLYYANSKNLWIDTQQNIVKYIKEKQATDVKTKVISDKKVVLSLKNGLDAAIYDQPLTLETVVPNAWETVTVEQAGNIQEVLPIKGNIYYNVLPSDNEITITSI